MLRLPRLRPIALPSLVPACPCESEKQPVRPNLPAAALLACALALPVMGSVAWAQETMPAAPTAATVAPPTADAPAADATPAAQTADTSAGGTTVATEPDQSLRDSVDDFWHYAKIARYDVAASAAQHVLAMNADPQQLLSTFESVAAQHHDNLDEWLLRWQAVDPLQGVTTQLITALNKGHMARRNDPKYIEQNIQMLATNQRGYDIGVERLRDSGELAVPMMIDYLRDPDKIQYHGSIRRALRSLGLPAVNPLLAATEMKDERTLMEVVSALGDIGYDVAVPYLARLLQLNDVPSSVKATTTDALRRLRVEDPAHLSATDLFYDLGERFYYDNAAVRADTRSPVGFVWYWSETKGLIKVDVPQPIFHDVMAKRACEYSLKLGQSQGDALSLWLAAAFLDEAQAPHDPTLPPDSPPAHYYGVAAGTKFLNNTLARANRDRNAPVAMASVLALEGIGGQANLFAPGPHPLMDALQFPDRLVRYEAAFALADALPKQSFSGEERVVPLLSEALSQSSAANILVVVPTQEQLNGLQSGLHQQGYNVVGGTNAEAAVAAAAERPTIDAILISEDLGPSAIDQLSLLISQTPRLQRAVRLIDTKTKASPYAVQADSDPMLSLTQAPLTDYAGLKTALDDARKRGGLLPLDKATSDRYATRAADLLARIAVNRSPVYDLNVALNLLLSALDDPRPDIVKDDATVLGLINNRQIQTALLQKANDPKEPADLKIALYKALATNSRNFGNQLDEGSINALQQAVSNSAEVPVRTAAAEARGALNLPADQAKQLVIAQSKTTEQ